MTGFNYLINLTVLNGGAFGKLASMAGGFENSLEKVQGEVGQTQSKLKDLGNTGRSTFSSLRSSLMGWVAGLGIAAAAMGSLSTTADISSLDTAITFAGGAEGAANLAHVEATAARLNTPLMAAKEGFKTLTGSMIGTNITALQQRDIFDSVAVASRVMGLSADNTTGAILALGQMASKGKVQAEELRGQLGERIPGAFGIAARAMGVSTAELNKMMEQGQVIAEDFLPKFAAEMQRTFGPGLEAAMNTPRVQFDKFGNSILNLKEMIGTQLMPTATGLIDDVFVPMVSWIGQNIELLKFLGVAIGGVWAAMKIYNIVAGISALMTGGLTGAVNALTLAFYANPIGLIIAAVIAVGAAVYYAWNHFESFRGVVSGVWEIIRPVATFIADVFTWNLRMAGAALQWIWEKTEGFRKGLSDLIGSIIETGKWIWESLIKPFTLVGQVISLLEPLFGKAGVSMGNNFTEGWNKGVGSLDPGSAPGGALAAAGFSTPGSGAGAGAGTGTGAGAGKASKISDNITGGGQRNVTINVGKLNEGGITINTTNLKEGSAEVEALLMKIMLQVVNSGNQQQGG